MKYNALSFVLGPLFLFTFTLYAQQNPFQLQGGGEYLGIPNKTTPCLTDEQRTRIIEELNANMNMLKESGRLAFQEHSRMPVSYIWPIQQASGFSYNSTWGISNYVDHNTSFPNQLQDYNCGTKTYDTTGGYNHQGVDVFTWPFGWKQMEDGQTEIIAAAAGQIIAKQGSQNDRSCSFNGTPWNAVYVQHSDGSVAWYGHMKQNSLTTKNVGDMVSQGEFLGIVGSSGNSTGPHLHFETHTDDTYTQLVDPYAGPCNSLNANSWWASQRPYEDPKVNAMLTHNAVPEFPSCPTTETPHISNQFDVNESIYFAMYLRDQEPGTTVNLKLRRPDGTFLYNWNFDLTTYYQASWWWWNFDTLNVEGEWQWEATYNSETVTHSFNVGTLSVKNFELSETSIYPNPAGNSVQIESPLRDFELSLTDVSGRRLFREHVVNQSSDYAIDLTGLHNGLYFLTVKTESNEQRTFKVLKQ